MQDCSKLDAVTSAFHFLGSDLSQCSVHRTWRQPQYGLSGITRDHQ